MNKKMRELLAKINAKKEEVRNLVDEGKVEEAKNAKKELQDLQDSFDLLKDLDDKEYEDAAGTILEGAGTVLTAATEERTTDAAEAAEKEFANAFRSGFPKNDMSEGVLADGGYTVPEDIETRIRTRRDAKMSLRQEVEVIPVKTKSGQRTYKKRAQQTGFKKVGEGGKIGKKETPQFERLTWDIDKYAGYLPVTNELREDSDANITQLLVDWIGDEARVTDNNLITGAIKEKFPTPVEFANLDGIKKALNVTLGQAFKSTSKVYTNDDGLQWLDTLTDKNGRYLLTVSPTDPMDLSLTAGATKVKLRVLPNDEFPSDTETAGKRKIPMWVGDMKELVALFDRKKTTLKWTDTAAAGDLNAFEEDLTLVRAVLREDVEIKDEKAFVRGQVTIDDAEVTGQNTDDDAEGTGN